MRRLVDELALDAGQQARLEDILAGMRERFQELGEVPEADRRRRAERGVSSKRCPASSRRVLAEKYASRRVSGNTLGTRLRPHCSQAAITTDCQCATRLSARSADRRTTLRRDASGWIDATPSSTAFWIV